MFNFLSTMLTFSTLPILLIFILPIHGTFTCDSSTDCISTLKSRCNPSTNECDICLTNADCAHFPDGGTCDTSSGACVPDCSSGGYCDFRTASKCSSGKCEQC